MPVDYPADCHALAVFKRSFVTRWRVKTLSFCKKTGILFLLGLLSGLTGCSDAPPDPASPPSPAPAAALASSVTFYEHVAPILVEHCLECHFPDGPAPFAFLRYGDVKKHGKQILEVVDSGFMPPWLPAPGSFHFRDERQLTATDKDRLRRWVEAGMPEGNVKAAPPDWQAGDDWHLGEPDLVVTSVVSFLLPADGPDVFHNLVIRPPVDRSAYVSAVELRPTNPQAVHHAILKVDHTGEAMRLAAETESPGFPGMEAGGAHSPDGHFIGWTPGKRPPPVDPSTAWRIDPGTDLVLQLHMPTTGKPEAINMRIGFHFSEIQPARQPVGLLLHQLDLEIPPGRDDVWIEDEIALPVDVEVINVYPHAHYLAREVIVAAVLPDGVTNRLLHIPDWDFNWQDEYRFVTPLRLPANTILRMRIRYDNTADNPRNPNDPPQTVRYGPNSTDEMGACFMQLIPIDPKQRFNLDLALHRHRFNQSPDDWIAANDVGYLLATAGRNEDATKFFLQAIELNPRYAAPHYHLGLIAQQSGHVGEAIGHYEKAVALNPALAAAYGNLGHAYASIKNLPRAIELFQKALAVNPALVTTRSNLASAMLMMEDPEAAANQLYYLTQHHPDFLPGYEQFARVLDQLGQQEDALLVARTGMARARELGNEPIGKRLAELIRENLLPATVPEK